MLLSSFEKFVMRSSLRAWFLERVEAPMLFQGLTKGQFKRILELGCGNGFGTFNILRWLEPQELIATDYDPEMLARACHYLDRQDVGKQVQFRQADATQLPFADGEFDAIVSIGILHHIRDYPKALAEIYRILKPGGSFLIEEVTKDAHFWPINRLMIPAVLFEDEEIPRILQHQGFSVTPKGRYLKAFLLFECQKPIS